MPTIIESPREGSASVTPMRPRGLVALHWLSVCVLLLGVGAILVRSGIEGRVARGWLLDMHRWCGLSLLALAIVRLVVRLRLGRLPVVVQATKALRAVAALTHGALYALLVSVPLLGWALSSAADQPLTWFGLPLPALVEADEDLSDALSGWHALGAWVLGGLVLAHVAAALWHHFIQRDAVLRSMWPPWRRREVTLR